MFHSLSTVLLPSLMIVAALTDASAYRIPNWLTALTAALFAPMAIFTGMPLADMGWHLLAGLMLFAVGYGLFELKLFGGGDAKLLAAAGLWFGPSHVTAFILLAAIAGGVLAICYTIWSVFAKGEAKPAGKTAGIKAKSWGPQLPYGVALCIGAILAFPQTWWMTGA